MFWTAFFFLAVLVSLRRRLWHCPSLQHPVYYIIAERCARGVSVPAKWGGEGGGGGWLKVGFHREHPYPAKPSHFHGPIMWIPICRDHNTLSPPCCCMFCGPNLGFKGHSGACEGQNGSFWDQSGSLGDHSGQFWVIIFGSLCDHFGIFLASFCGRFCVGLATFLVFFVAIVCPSLGPFCPFFFEPFLRSFCGFWGGV